ncbi:MAG TPA: TIGR03435 family protein [Candidatus Limnocylindrales bacterium]|nr:TIGR03435 family protein [Candidatus Limnocylindrales bacterium]
MMRSFLFLLAACVLFGQSPARPRFDVASVKPSEEKGSMYVRVLPGGHVVANAPARLILMNAYGVQFSQLAGAPDWLSTETWSVDARAEGDPTRDDLMLMLQSVLEDRFHLKAHHENREMPVYALTVARNGPKLAPPKEGACATPVPLRPELSAPPCGRVRISMSPDGVLLEGGSAAMAELARVLAIPLGRPVVDRTGLSGTYDIRLQVSEEKTGATPLPADVPGYAIFTNIQEQLGLKLVADKAPVDMLVIDRIDRPTAN